MSGATATASGDRSVAVAGDIRDSIVVTGDRNVLVVPEGLAGTLLQRAVHAPTVTARGRPVAVRPPPFGDRIGRAAEIAALRGHRGRALSVVGEALIGKTYVLSAAFDAATPVSAPDGIVFLYGRERPLRDLLQAVWEAFYDSDPPTVPSDAQLRRDLAEREGVVVIDSAELTHADAQALAAALPRSQVLVATRERVWWDGDAVTVAGLDEGDALALLARELGRTIAPADEAAARVVCHALGGRPVPLKQVAGLVRGGERLPAIAGRLSDGTADSEVARDAIARATPTERELLASLVPFAGLPVGIPLLDELLGSPAGGLAASLAERGLLRRGSPRFALALPADAVGMLDGAVAERAVLRAVAWASRAPASAVQGELDPLLALWRGLRRAGGSRGSVLPAPYEAVVALGRALVPALVRARRLTTWGLLAEHLDGVAKAAGDAATQAWARHELGTQSVVTGDPGGGAALLRDALATRRALGDRAGARATRRNLRVVAPPPGPPPWVRGVLLGLAATAVIAGLVAVIGSGADVIEDPATTEDGTDAPDGTDPNDADTDSTEAETGTETETGTEPGTEPGTETEPETDTDPPRWRLTVVTDAGSGSGRVTDATEDGALIDCPGQCTTDLEVGASIELLAEEDEGSRFVGWGTDACPAEPSCTVAGDSDVTLVPRFEEVVQLALVLEGASIPEAQWPSRSARR